MNIFKTIFNLMGASEPAKTLPWNITFKPKKAMTVQRENELRTLLGFVTSTTQNARKLIMNFEQGKSFCSSLGRNVYDSWEFLRIESGTNAKTVRDLAEFFTFKTTHTSVTNPEPSVDEIILEVNFLQECYRTLIHAHIRGVEMTFEQLMNSIIEDEQNQTNSNRDH